MERTTEESVGLNEVWRLFKETDSKFKETDNKFKETERLLKESALEVDRRIERLSREIGNLTGKWGRFVEGMIVPAARRMFAERGIPVHKTAQRVCSDEDGGIEIDVLAHNKDHIVAIEVKSTLSVEDVNEHIRRLKKFKTYFPEYSGYRIVGAVAGIVFESEADKYAYRQGLFVIAQNGESVNIINDEKFQPALW